jgi:polygalacturonase
MNLHRRKFLKFAAAGLVTSGAPMPPISSAVAYKLDEARVPFNIKSFGAAGDGKAIDTSAVNRAIAAAAESGDGTVLFPAGVYLCHSIRLKSYVTLRLEPGAIIQAAPCCGYDAAESNAPFESYQDFGHNHWHNSLIWGEGIHDVMICGPGLICGSGLARGEIAESGRPAADSAGAADKVIALKRCRNIAILAAGHFGILATGVDDLTLHNLKKLLTAAPSRTSHSVKLLATNRLRRLGCKPFSRIRRRIFLELTIIPRWRSSAPTRR